MNARQARRIALAANASYILFGASTEGITLDMSDSDAQRYEKAQREMAWQMLRKAGFDEPMQADEIVAAVLGAHAGGGSR